MLPSTVVDFDVGKEVGTKALIALLIFIFKVSFLNEACKPFYTKFWWAGLESARGFLPIESLRFLAVI